MSFGDHAYPILMSVTVEVVPPRAGPVVVGYHLHTLLAALVVVWFPVAPVRV